MSKNFTDEELVNMSTDTFRSQLGERKYKDYIQYLVKRYKKHELAELSLYYLEQSSEDLELCRQSICHEIESNGLIVWQSEAREVFDLIHKLMVTWNEECTDSDIIDMFQNISFLYAANCHVHKDFRKVIGVKVGLFS